MTTTPIAPAELLRTLKEASRPQKQRNLDIVYDVCEDIHKSGGADFSLANIGRLTLARSGPSPRTLYTAQSKDFRLLVQAWKDHHAATAAPAGRAMPRALGDEDLVRRVEDPALRSLLSAVVAERNRLRAEINVLRANCNLVIDRRVQTSAGVAGVQLVAPHELLTDVERESLQRAIAKPFLEQEGWSEGEYGEVLNAKGRRLFGHGFIPAIRKLLA